MLRLSVHHVQVKVSLCLLGFCGILLWNRGDAFRLSMDADENMEKYEKFGTLLDSNSQHEMTTSSRKDTSDIN